jgi:membrane-associated protease RseP (regulator of RpoE activity)
VLDLLTGWDFAVPLMAILLSHEMGHYVAARLHRVDTSPPYFIPMPLVSLLGTMGAVIQMRGRIESRNALLDIGASGPLAGMVVALPVLVYGLATSPVESMAGMPEGTFIEGRSILYLALLYLTHGPIPEGHDIFLNATAFAGWAGLLVTMMNLIPIGQLDGGHVAYALLGPRQDVYARRLHRALPLVAVVTGAYFIGEAWLLGATPDAALAQWPAGIHWLLWFVVISIIGRFAGGTSHPPTDDDQLSKGRRAVAAFTLVLFALLFMPSWVREP